MAVSDLWRGVDEKRLAKTFGKFGPLREVLVAKQPPWVAFVYFEEEEDAAKCLEGVLVLLLESYWNGRSLIK